MELKGRFPDQTFQETAVEAQLKKVGGGCLVEKGAGREMKSRPRLPSGLIQLQFDRDFEYPVKPGYSGTPVFDLTTQTIVGIITRVDSQADIGSGRMIPVEWLKEVRPDLFLPRPKSTSI